MALLDERLTMNEDRVRRLDDKLDTIIGLDQQGQQQQGAAQGHYAAAIKAMGTLSMADTSPQRPDQM